MFHSPPFTMARVAVAAIVCTVMFGNARAQQVLASSGAYFQNAGGSIAFTIGQPVIATHTSASMVITQGFHQPPEELITQVLQVTNPAIQLIAFPNPAREEVTVLAQGVTGQIDLVVLDAIGRAVASVADQPERSVLDVRHLASGCYFIRASTAQQLLTTIQLTIAR